jgi:DNA adenine methylase
MQYMGGKSKISKDIAEILNKYTPGKPFVSLFCGALSVESKVIASQYILNNSHKYLIALFRAMQDGFEPPENVSRDEYYYIKEHKDENPAITGFVGFGCSFGGRWFEGYAKNKTGTNYAKQSKNSLMKKFDSLMGATFYNGDYKGISIPAGAIVYADPPYANTKKFSNKSFGHSEFWEHVSIKSKDNIIFISELIAPKDFVFIWERPVKRVLDVNKDNIFASVEKLYVHESNVEKL